MDTLKRAALGSRLAPVIITRGEMERRERGYYLAPKRDLAAGGARRPGAGGG